MTDVSRRDFIKQSLAAGMVTVAAGQAKAKPAKPNVLFIMTDTQRKDDMGAYGNPVIKTPHLDRLANEGTKFEECYSQYPVCMPARATIFTGRYPMAHGVWSNGVPLPAEELTMAHFFARHGYRTGGAGKFHFLPHYPYRKNPLPLMRDHPEPFYGFQEFHLGEDGRSGEQYVWLKENHPEHADKPDHEIPLELHNTYWSAQHTIDFIGDCAKNNEPFFAFCSFVDPHQGYNPPSPYREMYKEEDMPPPLRKEGELEGGRFASLPKKNPMKRYNERLAYERTQHYGEMTFIDDQVGRIVKKLEALGVRDNTMIVFISDHGDMLGDHWLWWKGSYHYRECSNVPFFINWPGRVKAGKVVHGFAQQTDVFPTIADLAGLAIPVRVQGKSMKNVVTSDSQDTGYDSVYQVGVATGAYDEDFLGRGKPPAGGKNEEATDTYTIRTQDWRCTFYANRPDGELYDQKKDPHEFENKWDDPAYQDVKRELLQKLMNRTAAARDPLPKRIRPY